LSLQPHGNKLAGDGWVFANDWQGQSLPIRRPGLSRKSSPNVVVNKFAGIDVGAQHGQHQLKTRKARIIGRPALHGTPHPPAIVIGKKPEPPGKFIAHKKSLIFFESSLSDAEAGKVAIAKPKIFATRVGVTGAVAPNKSIDGVLDRFYRAPARPDRRAGDAQAARRLSCRSRGRSPCGRSSGRSSSLRPRDRGEGRLDPAIIGRSAPSPF